MNHKVDKFLSSVDKWQDELEALQMIILDCGLTEELKWGAPIYTWQGRNILGINGRKEFCSLGFFKGALLDDANGILVKPGKYTQEGRYVPFTSVKQIAEMEPVIKSYIYEAIEVEKAGVKLVSTVNKTPAIPEELLQAFAKKPALKKAFNALTPGRQRAYLLYFAAPKQSKTRAERIEKYVKQILIGKGINDDYLQTRK